MVLRRPGSHTNPVDVESVFAILIALWIVFAVIAGAVELVRYLTGR